MLFLLFKEKMGLIIYDSLLINWVLETILTVMPYKRLLYLSNILYFPIIYCNIRYDKILI